MRAPVPANAIPCGAAQRACARAVTLQWALHLQGVSSGRGTCEARAAEKDTSSRKCEMTRQLGSKMTGQSAACSTSDMAAQENKKKSQEQLI